MSGSDPLDLIDGLTTTDDVSKSETRAELLALARSFPTAANVATYDLSGRSVIYIAEYRRFFRKNTADTTTATSESLVRDINGLAFEVIDASAEQVSFSAHRNNVNQSGITTATATAVIFGTEEFDNGGYYDATTGLFTPPAGNYLIVAAVGFLAGLVDQARFGFYLTRNGNAERLFLDSASGTEVQNVVGVWGVSASGTDAFGVKAYAEGAGDKTVYGSARMTYFQAFKIDGERGDDGSSFSADVIVVDITARDTHGSDPIGTRVAVSDIGDGRTAVYELLSTGPAVWSSPVYLTSAGVDSALAGQINFHNFLTFR